MGTLSALQTVAIAAAQYVDAVICFEKRRFFVLIETIWSISNLHFARCAHKIQIGGTVPGIKRIISKPKHRFLQKLKKNEPPFLFLYFMEEGVRV
ncbi:hypothetical protein [Methanimicrococcus hacksteinii]|uniref:hypothetical protein n=1 Tax=Methanimicrococcus hacksteinii TaxID=3028293 RepID=UPI00298F1814|nr:hypothetical protein [Methanimicrococcus sp. At1]